MTLPSPSSADARRHPPLTLDAAALHQPLLVQSIHAPHGAPEWAGWLEEIGFLPGEQVNVLTRGVPGGDPLVVRVGDSTFALRRAEAACIGVVPVAASGAGEARHA